MARKNKGALSNKKTTWSRDTPRWTKKTEVGKIMPRLLVGSVLLIILVFCVSLLCLLTFWVMGCDVRDDFHINRCSFVSTTQHEEMQNSLLQYRL
jgi:hypothetical protein